MVNVAHDGHDRRATDQLLFAVISNNQCFFDVCIGNTFYIVTEFFDHELCRIGIEALVDGRHDAHAHQSLDHVGCTFSHTVGQFLNGDNVRDGHVTHDFLFRFLRAHGTGFGFGLLALDRCHGTTTATFVTGHCIGDRQLATTATIISLTTVCTALGFFFGALARGLACIFLVLLLAAFRLGSRRGSATTFFGNQRFCRFAHDHIVFLGFRRSSRFRLRGLAFGGRGSKLFFNIFNRNFVLVLGFCFCRFGCFGSLGFLGLAGFFLGGLAGSFFTRTDFGVGLFLLAALFSSLQSSHTGSTLAIGQVAVIFGSRARFRLFDRFLLGFRCRRFNRCLFSNDILLHFTEATGFVLFECTLLTHFDGHRFGPSMREVLANLPCLDRLAQFKLRSVEAQRFLLLIAITHNPSNFLISCGIDFQCRPCPVRPAPV